MIKSFLAGRRLLLLAGALLLLAAPLGERTAKADFITGNAKLLECGLDVPCGIPIEQTFMFEGDNTVTVFKEVTVPANTAIHVFHVFAGLWQEKDLKHIGFLCTDATCSTLTGFDSVQFDNPRFDINIPDLHGLSRVGSVVPDVKDPLPSPQGAVDWLPNRPVFTDFFLDITVVDSGLVPVLFTHLPEPATVTLFGFGLLGLGLAARRRRTV